jgi:hypothetical protein
MKAHTLTRSQLQSRASSVISVEAILRPVYERCLRAPSLGHPRLPTAEGRAAIVAAIQTRLIGAPIFNVAVKCDAENNPTQDSLMCDVTFALLPDEDRLYRIRLCHSTYLTQGHQS